MELHLNVLFVTNFPLFPKPFLWEHGTVPVHYQHVPLILLNRLKKIGYFRYILSYYLLLTTT